jgi:cysteinyl-tRNA synthetase
MRLYNTLTRSKELFTPIDPRNVRMYVCGPTVYDFAHIGNARPVIVFDLLYRFLKLTNPIVTYARNITDVDDKINARAFERGITIRELTDGTLAQFHEDIDALGVLRPSIEPRATDHIAEMITIIESLVKNGHAYAKDGHVLFNTPSMKDYGQLARRSSEELIMGARVEVAPYKKDPTDFVLWKPSGEKDPAWDSPWGRGRPGWHIECSAMAEKHLGETFDIHGGGLDLTFPHHENEIAQSRCAHGTPVMANVWMHNGFLQVEGQKMSKSLGNFFTIRDVLKDFSGDTIRFAMLKTHYRSPIDWTVKALEEAESTLHDFRRAIDNTMPSSLPLSIIEALNDDLNTAKMIAEMHALKNTYKAGLAAVFAFLGLNATIRAVDSSPFQALLDARIAARANKNFAESDRLRDELAKLGIAVKDSKEGQTWEKI